MLSYRGKIFCMFTGGVFVAKLPRLRINELIGTSECRPYEPPPGRMMKEWAAMERGDWLAVAHEAYTYACLNTSRSERHLIGKAAP